MAAVIDLGSLRHCIADMGKIENLVVRGTLHFWQIPYVEVRITVEAGTLHWITSNFQR